MIVLCSVYLILLRLYYFVGFVFLRCVEVFALVLIIWVALLILRWVDVFVGFIILCCVDDWIHDCVLCLCFSVASMLGWSFCFGFIIMHCVDNFALDLFICFVLIFLCCVCHVSSIVHLTLTIMLKLSLERFYNYYCPTHLITKRMSFFFLYILYICVIK